MTFLARFGLLTAFVAAAVAARTHDTNPMSSPEDFAEGKRLYRIHCGVCHGMQGTTGRGVRLARRSYRHGNTDAELFDLIEGGIPGTDMPGLWLEEEEIWKILLFVRQFAETASEGCLAEGDLSRGRAVFAAQGGCLGCHTVEAEGGRLGPDLSFAGELFTPEQLRRALLDPGGDVAERYQAVRVSTAAGETVEGAWINENAYHIFLMDRSENIRKFRKADLRSLERPTEPLMPPYGDLLSEADLDHLIAYLCSLRGKARKEAE